MIKKFTQLVFIVALVVGAGSEVFAQTYYVAVADGLWSDPNTWANPLIGTPGSGAGTGIPQANSTVYTNGYEILVDQDITITNLGVRSTNNNAGVYQLNFGGSFFAFTITITGALQGSSNFAALPIASVPSGLPLPLAPAESVISDDANIIFKFTGTGATGAITNWSVLAPINTVHIDPGSGIVRTANASGGVLGITQDLSILSGTFRPQRNVSDESGSSVILVSSGATLDLFTSAVANVTGSGGILGTKFNDIQISGTVGLGTVNSLTTNNITLNSSGILNVAFNGANQTQGWWYQSNSPSSFSLNPTSQINYTANAAQNVFATTYGNLSLSTTSAFTKSLVGNGMMITGNLSVGTNVTFSPSSLVTFSGSVASQAVSGGGTLSFVGGLEVNKSAGTITLSKNITVAGLTLTLGALDIGSQIVTMNTGGLSITGGSLTTPSTGTFNFTGTTTISRGGSAPGPTFPNFTITGGTVTVPTGTDNVLLPSGTNGIKITGNFTNTGGTFNENGGLIVFSGTGTQTIQGSATTFNNVHISNATGVSLSTTTNMLGILALSSTGKINTNGFLVLKSNAQNSSSGIGNLQQPLNFTGDVTIEREVNGPDTYRYMSMPITNGNVGIWKTAFGDVTGNFSDACIAPSANVADCTAPSLFYYDAAATNYVAVGSGLSTGSTPINNRVGYSLYTYLPGNAIISASGTIETGPFSLTSISTGYNLLPNPYPSPIDWDLMDRTGFDNTIHLRTANLVFATYVAGGSICTGCSGFNSNWRGEIAIGQAYWVQSTGASSMAFSESVKTTAIQTNYVREAAPQDYLRITMSNNTQSDDAVIMFKQDASVSYDGQSDGPKFRNGDYSIRNYKPHINFSTYTDNVNKDMAINLVPLVSCDVPSKIKFKMRDVNEGQYSFKFTDLEAFTVGYGITLIDNFLSKEVAIANGDQYAFEITVDAASSSANRFEMKFTAPTLILNTNAPQYSSSTTCDATSVAVTLTGQQGVTYQLFKGETSLGDAFVGTGSAQQITLLKSALITGDNVLNLKATGLSTCNSRIYSNALTITNVSLPQITSVKEASVCTSGAMTLQASGAPSNGFYKWYTSKDGTTFVNGASGSSLTTPVLNASTSYYVAAVNSLGCESGRTEVKATVNITPTPTITLQGANQLQSSSKEGNQWFKDGQLIPQATSDTYAVNASGIYTVQVTSSYGCNATSTARTMVITGLEHSSMVGVYPNPTDGKIVISLDKETDDHLKGIYLYDLKGSLITGSDTQLELRKKGEKQIDISDQKAGIFILHIVSEKEVKSVKILKK